MWRKRATPAPAFQVPASYSPISGKHAPIGEIPIVSRVALFQVIEADTHDNYLVCRGFHTENERFFHSINIAKPYGMRGINGAYVVAQMITAMKPAAAKIPPGRLTRLGTNPGKAETTIGHPADLDEEVVLLQDDDGVYLEWIEVGDGAGERDWYFTLAATLVQWTTPVVPVAAYRRVKNPASWGRLDIDCTQPMLVGDYALAGFHGVAGANGWAEMWVTENGVVGIIRGLNCPDACVCGTDYTETAPCLPSATPSSTPSATPSRTPSATPSRTPSHTQSPSRTPSHTPSST